MCGSEAPFSLVGCACLTPCVGAALLSESGGSGSGQGSSPAGLRASMARLWQFRRWLLAAMLLRVVAMPIAYHGDLYSVYWRAHLLAFHGILPEHNQVLSHLIHGGVLFVYRALWPGLGDVWIHPFSYGDSGVPFLSVSGFPLLLVLLKLPYLVFDIGCAILLMNLVMGRKGEKAAIGLWALNPVLLFSVYLYGRYETIPLFFVLWSLVMARRQRSIWAAVILSLSVATRLYTVLLAPFYILLLDSGWKRRLRLVLLMLVPLCVVLGIQALRAGSTQGFLIHSELLSFLSMPHRGFLFAAKIPILQMDSIQLWPFFMTLLVLAAGFCRRTGYAAVWRFGLAAHLLLFSLVLFHPQWFAWCIPFLALLAAERRGIVWLHGLQVVALAVYAFQFGWDVTVGLFTPVLGWSGAASLPTPLELLERMGLGGVFVGFWRSVLTAVNVWIIGEAVSPLLRRAHGFSSQSHGA